jgi:hypothetical protein
MWLDYWANHSFCSGWSLRDKETTKLVIEWFGSKQKFNGFFKMPKQQVYN